MFCVFVLTEFYMQCLVSAACGIQLVFYVVVLLCYVQTLVCVMFSSESVLCVLGSHEARRFAPSLLRFAR